MMKQKKRPLLFLTALTLAALTACGVGKPENPSVPDAIPEPSAPVETVLPTETAEVPVASEAYAQEAALKN